MLPYLLQSESQGLYNGFEALHNLSHFLFSDEPHILPSPMFTSLSPQWPPGSSWKTKDFCLWTFHLEFSLLRTLFSLRVPLHSSFPHFVQVTFSVRSCLTPLYELQSPHSLLFFPLHYLSPFNIPYTFKIHFSFASFLLKYKLHEDKRLMSVLLLGTLNSDWLIAGA